MKNLQEELKMRTTIDERFERLFPQHLKTLKDNTVPINSDYDCLRSMISTYEDSCGTLNAYSMKWTFAFTAECESTISTPEVRANTIKKIQNECANTE